MHFKRWSRYDYGIAACSVGQVFLAGLLMTGYGITNETWEGFLFRQLVIWGILAIGFCLIEVPPRFYNRSK